jgi:hypothetical protein
MQWSLQKSEDGAYLIPEARASGPSKLTRDKAGRGFEEKAKHKRWTPDTVAAFSVGGAGKLCPFCDAFGGLLGDLLLSHAAGCVTHAPITRA